MTTKVRIQDSRTIGGTFGGTIGGSSKRFLGSKRRNWSGPSALVESCLVTQVSDTYETSRFGRTQAGVTSVVLPSRSRSFLSVQIRGFFSLRYDLYVLVQSPTVGRDHEDLIR